MEYIYSFWSEGKIVIKPLYTWNISAYIQSIFCFVSFSQFQGGVFKPLRKWFSTPIAVFGTFIASGLLHEYVIFGFYRGTKLAPSYGKNMVFFAWNGVLIILESIVGKSNIFKWIAENFPRPLISILVVLTALPLGHLFLDDWVESGYYHHMQVSLFMIVPLED